MRRPPKPVSPHARELESLLSSLPEQYVEPTRAIVRAYKGMEDRVITLLAAAQYKGMTQEYLEKLVDGYMTFDVVNIPAADRKESMRVKKIFAELYGELRIQS